MEKCSLALAAWLGLVLWATHTAVLGQGRAPRYYNGKTLAQWIEQLGYREPGQKREAAAKRAEAAQTLCKIARKGKADAATIVQPLMQALGDDDRRVRLTALEALAAIPGGGTEKVAGLAAALKGADPALRLRAARALGAVGLHAAPVSSQLAAVLADLDVRVRAAAAGALGAIGPPARDAVPALAAALGDPEEIVRLEAARALRALGPAARGAVRDLVKVLTRSDENPHVRLMAVQALAAVGPGALPAAAALRQVRDSRDPDWRLAGVESARALWKLGRKADEYLPSLSRVLHRDPNPDARRRAAQVLGEIGPAAKSAVADVVDALDDLEDEVSSAAAEALRKIDPGYAAKIPKTTQ
jgi:HEAT repeat protein